MRPERADLTAQLERSFRSSMGAHVRLCLSGIRSMEFQRVANQHIEDRDGALLDRPAPMREDGCHSCVARFSPALPRASQPFRVYSILATRHSAAHSNAMICSPEST